MLQFVDSPKRSSVDEPQFSELGTSPKPTATGLVKVTVGTNITVHKAAPKVGAELCEAYFAVLDANVLIYRQLRELVGRDGESNVLIRCSRCREQCARLRSLIEEAV